jgi:hypothetical protein
MTQPKYEEPRGKPITAHNDTSPVPSYGLLYTKSAHNQGEIISEKMLRLAITWAEAMLQQHSQSDPAAAD